MTPSDWPWQFSFPPFFTLQPNTETRNRQLHAWSDLVLKFHRANRQFVLDVRESGSSPLFHNADIKRTLSKDGVLFVLNSLAQSGHAEPIDKSKFRWHIYWHTLDEWADLIYSWADQTGQVGSVCTLYEISNTPDVEFTGISQDVLVKALKVLESKSRAEIIEMDDSSGVKFF